MSQAVELLRHASLLLAAMKWVDMGSGTRNASMRKAVLLPGMLAGRPLRDQQGERNAAFNRDKAVHAGSR